MSTTSDSSMPANAKPATLPADFIENDAVDPTPGRREDREPISARDGDGFASPAEELERCEQTIQDHRREQIDVSRAARRIIEDHLYEEKGFATLDDYTRDVFGFGAKRFYQYRYHAETYDALEAHREEIAERSSTNVEDLPLPSVRSWARPLHKIANSGKTDELIDIWAAVINRYGMDITKDKVESVRDELMSREADSGEDSGTQSRDGGETGRSDTDGDDSQGAKGNAQNGEDSGGGAGKDEAEKNQVGGSESDSGGDDSTEEDPTGDASDGAETEENEPAPTGFSVHFSSEVNESTAPLDPSGGATASGRPTRSDIEALADRVEQKQDGFGRSSAEHMIASKTWRVLTPSSPEGIGTGLPEVSPSGVQLKPSRLQQVTGLPSGLEGERMLVCPGVDLFDEIVPSDVIEAILDRCRESKHTPVIFTRHLERAAGFDLSGVWVGTSTIRDSLKSVGKALKEAAPDSATRWVLYDVRDNAEPPSFSRAIDWIVFDPGNRNAGIALTLSEAAALVEAAEDVGAAWTFRDTFTTCGTSLPDADSS